MSSTNHHLIKILCIGDQHFKPSNIQVVDIFLQKLEEWLKKNPVDLIVSLGDLLHTHERLHTQALNKALQYIELLSRYAPTRILIGNHDGINNQIFLSENHWLNVVKTYRNVKVVDKILIENVSSTSSTITEITNCSSVPSVSAPSVKMTFCPYVPDGKFRNALDTRRGEWEDSQIIFAHQLFDGSKMGSIITEKVEKWDENEQMIVCGHIHDSQWVQDNIYIVGSAMQDSFGEREDKTLLLLELNENDYKDTSSSVKLNRALLENTPNFRLIDLDLPKKRILYMDISELSEFDVDLLRENTEYKLTVDGDEEEFNAFKKTLKYKDISKRCRIVFKHKRTFILNKKESIRNGDENQKIERKEFKTLLKDLVETEDNPYIMDLFNKIVLKRSGDGGESEEMLFL